MKRQRALRRNELIFFRQKEIPLANIAGGIFLSACIRRSDDPEDRIVRENAKAIAASRLKR